MQYSLIAGMRRSPGVLIAALFGASLVATSIALAQSAPAGVSRPVGDDSFETTGIVTQIPDADPPFGEWVVGGDAYLAVAGRTVIEDEFSIGDCAEVKYRIDQGVRKAGRISASDDCQDDGGPDPTPAPGTPPPPDDGDGHDDEGNGGYDDAYSDEFKGVVVDFPIGLIGEWTISSTTASDVYTATSRTRFEQRRGPFRVGACVEVKTDGVGSNLLKGVKTDDGCRGSAAESFRRLNGVLAALPDDPDLIGTWSVSWTISSTTYISDVQVVPMTRLEADRGPFYVGACVSLQYDPSNFQVRRAETKSFDECGSRSTIHPGGVVTLTDGTTVTIAPGAPISVTYGFVDARPDDPQIFGVWTISGTNYEAIAGATGFEMEHGTLDVGDCAKVRYFVDTIVIARLASEEDYKCTGTRDGDEQELAEAHGVVNFIPDGGYGIWQIGDLFYEAVTDTTEIIGAPVLSGIVEVKFSVAADGTLLAHRIKAEDIDDDDRRSGKAYGIVDARPTSPTVIGDWTIAGLVYSVTEQTRVRRAPDVGDCAAIYYVVQPDGTPLARRLKVDDEHCAPPPAPGEIVTQTAYGFVDDLPASGYVGTWLIAGVPYEADSWTAFDAGGGAFIVGSFVGVTYVTTDGVNNALSIAVYVPPNGGDGIVPSGTITVEETITGTEYYLDGQPLEIVGPTLVDDDAGEIQDGAVAYVNYYTSTVPAARGLAGATMRTATKLVTSGTVVDPLAPTPTPTATSTTVPPVTPTPMPTATPVPGTVRIYVPIILRK